MPEQIPTPAQAEDIISAYPLTEFASTPLLPKTPYHHYNHPSTNPSPSSPFLFKLANLSNSVPTTPPSSAAPKKPRGWSAMFKRRPTNLAAAATTNSSRERPAGTIYSQADFRRNFLKVHKDRVIRDNVGNCFRLHPIMMNGDCGFGAIAKGINCARDRVKDIAPAPPDRSPNTRKNQVNREPEEKKRWRRRRGRLMGWGMNVKKSAFERSPKNLQAKDIRKAMYDELRKARKIYLDDCEDFKGVFSDDDFDKLEREVSHPGIAGHWLGTVLGLLEHVIVAQAMNVNIFLYQFDLQRQCIRQFESATVEKPDSEVYLFFTGPAACGHFDTLVKISDPKKAMFFA